MQGEDAGKTVVVGRVKGTNINNRLKPIRKYADTDAVSVQHKFPPIGKICRGGSESGAKYGRNTPYKEGRTYQAHMFFDRLS
jgi:hypothetical protein